MMPAKHTIDHDAGLIVTVWSGPASGPNLTHALRDYQYSIKADSRVQTYHELVDFCRITDVDLTAREMMALGKVAQQSDRSDVRTRLALVVGSPLIYGLARMYTAYRNLVPNSNKELAVFRSRGDAVAWIYQSAPFR